MAASFSVEIGAWQRAYWTSGPAGADKFCVGKVAEIQEKLTFIATLLVQLIDHPSAQSRLENLGRLYCEKIAHYLPDRVVGGLDTELVSRGRGQKTRTPFHYPDFRHRFDDPEKLRVFFSSKIQKHEHALEMMQEASSFVDVTELKEAHRAARDKWIARQNLSDLSQLLLPSAEMSPHALMGIEWAHDQGYKGEGASAFLIENGIDVSHPALQEAVFPLEPEIVKQMRTKNHGSHVGGIIAARKSSHASYDHIGVAPLAKLQFIAHPSQIGTDNKGICIANYSQSMKKFYFKELQDILIIESIGNDGVVFSEEPTLRKEEAYLLDRLDLAIMVVNLQQNGLYPSSSSRLPGAEFSHATLCAVGSDVLSTVPENEYKKLSGTSMAAPHVTGVALLLKAAFPTLTSVQIRECILKGATPIVLDANKTPHLIVNRADLAHYTEEEIAYSQQFYGQGLLNAKGAIEYAKQLVTTSSPQP